MSSEPDLIARWEAVQKLRELANKQAGYGMSYHARGSCGSGSAELHLYGKHADAAFWLFNNGNELADAILTTLEASDADMVLVPREPTEAMLMAGAHAQTGISAMRQTWPEVAAAVYRAMLTTAHPKSEPDDKAFCNKCGFHGEPDERGQHNRPGDGQLCHYAAAPSRRESHEDLVGLSDRDLRLRAGDATHQHYKGGLYRLLGPINDSVTGEPLRYKANGEAVLVYEHVYPHERQLWARGEKEFHSRVPQLGTAAAKPEDWPLRFRPLG